MYELTVDLDESDRNYNKMKAIYPEGRQPIILTIQEIYDGMMEGKWDGRNPQLPEVKGYNSYIDKNTIRMTKGIYTPKALLFLADELNELMTSDDFKSVDIVKQSLGSIARLGRAAGVHLALACQRASGSTISTDLKNNIQMSVLLGGFDDGASQLMFEKDISQLAKPQIKGRGFLGSGNEIIETQTYYTQPEKDWEFDEEQKLSYNNPVFADLLKNQGRKIEDLDKGWVPQHKIGEAEPEPDEDEDEIEEDEDDIDDELNEDELFKSPTKSDRPHEVHSKRPASPSKEDDEPDEVSFKFGKKKDPMPTKPPKVEAPDLGLSGLESLFGPSSSPIVPDSTTSTRDKVADALHGAPGHAQPNIKLNIDKTSADQPMAPKPNVIKLNIKQKPQQ